MPKNRTSSFPAHPSHQPQPRSGSKTSSGPFLKRGSWTKFAGGFFLALAGSLLLFAPTILNRIAENNLSKDFQTEPVLVDLGNFGSVSSQDLPQRIVIPDLGIDLPVQLSPVRNGYWVVWEDTAGYGEGSAPPGILGNTVIFAHARKGLFEPLKRAKNGMLINVTTSPITYTYTITDIKTVLPYQVEVIAPTSDQTLTLYTCSGFLDKKRLIVTAKPV